MPFIVYLLLTLYYGSNSLRLMCHYQLWVTSSIWFPPPVVVVILTIPPTKCTLATSKLTLTASITLK